MNSNYTIAFFGSSILSAYWNGAATYYRGLIRALHRRGHRITFYEPDAYDRQAHRDMEEPDWVDVVVYANEQSAVRGALAHAQHADVIVKASGVGVFDELLESAVLEMQSPQRLALFLDVDAPATLDRVANCGSDAFRPLVPRYDAILTYGGGPPVMSAYARLGAQRCVPIYNALDPEAHHPVPADERFAATLAFLGNRLPDREARVEEFFLKPAAALPEHTFLLGGNGWGDKSMPDNVRYLGHVYTRDHNAFNCTPRAVININRESMARYGFSPPTRVFEATGAGACLISDDWEGIDTFFTPGEEILVARDGDDVIDHLQSLSAERAAAIGKAAYVRTLAEHTYAQRAEKFEQVLQQLFKAGANQKEAVL